MDEIGHYSGNRRQDTSSLEEPDDDGEKTINKWLKEGSRGREELLPKRVGRRMKKWKETVRDDVLVHVIGQSHIDVAWMWQFVQTRKKAQVTFRKAVFHSNLFPDDFCFALSEPILLEWIKEDDLELFKEIQEKVKAGNIELVGGAYVEPDCMMPSGEAFVRQRLYGMRFFRDNFGILPSVEWFLDSFGYNFGLPQILVKSGAKYFWTSKITWNKNTIFPFVNFWWQGPDGTRILTANFNMGTTPLDGWDRYEAGHKLLGKEGRKIWDYTIDYNIYPEHVENKLLPHIGCFFGKGDGGHGPTHEETATAMEWVKHDMFKWSRVETFYKELEKYSDRLPVWNDELYLEMHRGCFSNHAEVKRHNRKYENILTSLESLALYTAFTNSNYQYPADKIEALWKTTLKNQFHDVLPGSSIPEVYDECWDDWTEQDASIEELISEIGSALESKSKSNDSGNVAYLNLYNPLSWERTSRVFIPISIFKDQPKIDNNGKPNYARLELLNGEDKVVICQPIASEPENTIDRMPAGWWTVVSLKSLSCIAARVKILSDSESSEIEKQKTLTIAENSISNSFNSIRIDPNTGAMLELTAVDVNNKNNLLSGNSSNLTYGFLDRSLSIFRAWDLTKNYWEHPLDLPNDKDVSIKITDVGPIYTTLEITRTLGISPVTQKISLFKDCPEIFLEYLTDWKQEEAMLKIKYTTATNAEICTADLAYCAIEAKTNPEVPCDIARFEKICHKYFDLSTPDKKWGLAMLNEGKYAFDVKGGEMKLTLLRACEYPAPAPEAWVNQERTMNKEKYDHEVPKFSGISPFKCRYALFPHNGGALTNSDGTPNVSVKRKAEEFNAPVIVIPTENIEESQNESSSLLEILTTNVYLGVLKKNEWDGTGTVIARFIEGSGVKSVAKIKFGPELKEEISSIKAVDLLEREIEFTHEWDKENGILTFQMGKFEICTFELVI